MKIWHIYLVKVPFYEEASGTYSLKARPAIFYRDAGGDAVFLPLTSNQSPNGEKTKEANQFQVSVKYGRHGLVKVNSPITLNKKAVILSKAPIVVSSGDRKKIIKVWGKYMVWSPEPIKK